MLGVFDSGRGGLVAYRELRGLLPRANLIYLADRKNAPYGTRSEGEILELTAGAIERLTHMGADRVLIACCTASTVHERLPERLRQASIPIITPTAELCSESERVLVIATEHTVRCGAFSKEIAKFSTASVTEVPMQPLVSAIEWGFSTESWVEQITRLCQGYDSLILGCTHFSHLYDELRAVMPEINILSPAHIGAREIMRITTDREGGRDIYTCSPRKHYLHGS